MVSDLYAGGLRKVTGDLVVDDSFFDDVRVGPGFEQKKRGPAVPRAQRRPVAQLQRRRRARAARRRRRGAGARGDRSADALLHHRQRSAHRRQRAHARSPSSRTRRPITPSSTCAGRIRIGDAGQVQLRRVAHPDLYTANAFRELLSRRGIKVSGNIVRDATPTTAQGAVGALLAAARRGRARRQQALEQLHGRADPEDARRRDRRAAGHVAEGHRGGRRLLGAARHRAQGLQDDQRVGAVQLEPVLAGAADDAVARRLQGLPLRRRLHRLAGAGRRRRHRRRIAWRAGWPSATCAPRRARSPASRAWPATPARPATRRWRSPSS